MTIRITKKLHISFITVTVECSWCSFEVLLPYVVKVGLVLFHTSWKLSICKNSRQSHKIQLGHFIDKNHILALQSPVGSSFDSLVPNDSQISVTYSTSKKLWNKILLFSINIIDKKTKSILF